MHLVLGRRRFDVTHRAVIIAIVDDARPETVAALMDAGADGLALRSSSVAAQLCDRVDVPVSVLVSPGQIELSIGEPIAAFQPTLLGPGRVAQMAAAIADGERIVLSPDASTLRSDRRVVEVMARILAARECR